MNSCADCGTQYHSMASFCPGCGKPTGNTPQSIEPDDAKDIENPPKKASSSRVFVRCMGFVVMAFLFVYWIGSNSQSPSPQPSQDVRKASPYKDPALTVPTKPDLELIDDKAVRDEYSITITGRVKNNTSKTYSYAQVTYKLYNEANEQVGSTMANVNGLEPGAVWRFKAVGLTGEATNYKLGGITGF